MDRKIKIMREGAMHVSQYRHEPEAVQLSTDFAVLDELCRRLAKALRSKDSEDRAVALFCFGETYDTF